MIQACLHCAHEFDDSDRESLAGYCTKHCRRSARVMATMDQTTDWFACRLRQHIIRESWPDRERQEKARVDWKRQRAATREIAEESVFAAFAADLGQ